MISMLERCAVVDAATLCVAPGFGLAFGQDASPPKSPLVQILSPGEDSYVSGPTLLRARVEPAGAVAAVVFVADGRQVCVLTILPFECEWDAGPSLREHQVRLVVHVVGSGRAWFTESIDELQGAFEELLDELSNQYLLAYAPSDMRRDDTWHRITVDVDGRYEVRARQGYRVSTR